MKHLKELKNLFNNDIQEKVPRNGQKNNNWFNKEIGEEVLLQPFEEQHEKIHKTYTMKNKDQQAQSVYLGKAKEFAVQLDIQYKQSFNEVEYQSITPRLSQNDVKVPLLNSRIRQRNFSDAVVKDEIGFLSSNDFPYRLRLLDPSTQHCITCERQITYNQKKNTEKYCQGCEYGLEDVPFLINILYGNQPLIALDWIDSLAFNPFSTQSDHDESYLQLKQEKQERKDRISFEQCFDLMTLEEKLEIQCDHCQSLQQARTKFMLSQNLPNILIIHLKRYQNRDGYLEKIENDIQFPLKNLNLKQWIYSDAQNIRGSMSKEKDKIYDLYAVANHMGNGQMGHYTSFVAIQHEGKEFWISFDDDMTRIVSEEKILSPYSYLLFYKRREFSSSAIINLTFKSFDKNSK